MKKWTAPAEKEIYFQLFYIFLQNAKINKEIKEVNCTLRYCSQTDMK